MHAEWHFFATSQGKSAGDGASGTLKRLAIRANLQRIYEDQIFNHSQYHKTYAFWFRNFEREHEEEAKNMSRMVPGTHKLHKCCPS